MHVLILEIEESQLKGCIIDEQGKTIASHWVITQGLYNGVISDFKKLQNSIYTLIQKLEKTTKLKIKKTIVLLPSNHMNITYLSTKIKIRQTVDKSHLKQMVQKLNDICKANSLFLIKCFPFETFIDQQKVENPTGIYGENCEIKWSVLYLQDSIIQNFNNIFSNLYLKVIEYSSYSYEGLDYILDEDEKKLGATVIEINNTHTTAYIFKNNIPIQLVNLDGGYESVDHATAIKLNISIIQAKNLRKKYFSTILSEEDKSQHITLSRRNNEEFTLSRYEIIYKTLPYIKKLISSLKTKLEESSVLNFNNRIFLSGEIANITGIENLLKTHFKTNIFLLNHSNIQNKKYINIEGFISKMKHSKPDQSLYSKIKHYILLGLRKIYDMIKK